MTPVIALALAASSAQLKSISVTNRFSHIFCTGVCTDSDLVVRSDGLVTLRVRLNRRQPWKSYRYRISGEQVRQFWAAYDRIRPAGLEGPIGTCDTDTMIIDWDILWDGPDNRSRLRACSDAEKVRHTYWDGFRILRISPVTGERLSAEAAETFK
jgi:hypothetical protein